MSNFIIDAIKGTNRVRIIDRSTGRHEEVVVSEAVLARMTKAMSLAVPRELPSMKVCAFS